MRLHESEQACVCACECQVCVKACRVKCQYGRGCECIIFECVSGNEM